LSLIISGSTGPIFMIFSSNKRYLCEFYRYGLIFPIPQGTLPWQPIFGKIDEMTFNQHVGVPKQIRLSQFQFTVVKWQYFWYILCKFDNDQSTNLRDYAGSFYCVSKNDTDVALHNFNSHQLIFEISGRNVAERVHYQTDFLSHLS